MCFLSRSRCCVCCLTFQKCQSLKSTHRNKRIQCSIVIALIWSVSNKRSILLFNSETSYRLIDNIPVLLELCGIENRLGSNIPTVPFLHRIFFFERENQPIFCCCSNCLIRIHFIVTVSIEKQRIRNGTSEIYHIIRNFDKFFINFCCAG